MSQSFLENVHLMLDQAIERLDLAPGLAQVIRVNRSVYQVRFPLKIRGDFRVFEGWRAIHSEHRLPRRRTSRIPARAGV